MGKDTPDYRARVMRLHRGVYTGSLYTLVNDAIEALRTRGISERRTMEHLHDAITAAFHPATEVKDAKD